MTTTATALRRLYLTEDHSRVVPESALDAHTLWVAPGDLIPAAEVASFALVPGVDIEGEPEPVAEPAEEPAGKMRQPAANKAK